MGSNPTLTARFGSSTSSSVAAVNGGVAQLAEQRPPNPKVRGSSPLSVAIDCVVVRSLFKAGRTCKITGRLFPASKRPLQEARARVHVAQLVEPWVAGSSPVLRRGSALSKFWRGSSGLEERRVHCPEVDGSNPSFATSFKQ